MDGAEPPHIFGNIPSSSPEECVIRVYVIRVCTCVGTTNLNTFYSAIDGAFSFQAMGLQPQDIGGKVSSSVTEHILCKLFRTSVLIIVYSL